MNPIDIDKLIKKFNFSEAEEELVKYADTAETAKINRSKIIAKLILAKQIEKLQDSIKCCCSCHEEHKSK
jgi:hypothetical protein